MKMPRHRRDAFTKKVVIGAKKSGQDPGLWAFMSTAAGEKKAL